MFYKIKDFKNWAIFALFMALCSSAVAAGPDMTSIGLVLKDMQTNLRQGESVVLGFAQSLFWTLAGLSLFWDSVQWYFAETDFSQIIAELVKKCVYLIIYAMVLGVPGYGSSLAVATLNSVKTSADQIATGYGATASDTDPGSIISKGAALSLGIGTSVSVAFHSVKQDSSLSPSGAFGGNPLSITDNIEAVAMKFVLFLGCFFLAWAVAAFVLYVFVMVGIQIAVVNIEFALVGSLGLIYLAGAGSDWTKDYRNKWLGFVFNYMMKFALLMTIVSIGGRAVSTYITQMLLSINSTGVSSPDAWSQLLMGYLAIGALALVFKTAVTKVPEIFSSLMNATPSSAASSIAQSAGQGMQRAGTSAVNTLAKGTGAATGLAPNPAGGAIGGGAALMANAATGGVSAAPTKAITGGVKLGGGSE